MIAQSARAGSCTILRWLAGALIALPAAGAAYGQEDAQLAFNNHCRTCHTMEEGDHRMGPSLHNVIGREAGSLQGAAYSDAMRASTIVWDEETLDRFIENPEAVIPGNNMKPFAGISDPQTRAAILEHLRSQPSGGTQPGGQGQGSGPDR